MAVYERRSDISFEIMEEIGVLATKSTGWCKELNVVSWNGKTPKYDIREWDPHHTRMSRGVTLDENEMRQLLELLRRRRRYAARADDNEYAAERDEEKLQTDASDFNPVEDTIKADDEDSVAFA